MTANEREAILLIGFQLALVELSYTNARHIDHIDFQVPSHWYLNTQCAFAFKWIGEEIKLCCAYLRLQGKFYLLAVIKLPVYIYLFESEQMLSTR